MEIGQTYTSRATVGAEQTAQAVGSGDLPVLGTPAMIALMENAAMQCVAADLPAEQTTVGGQMNCTHLRPTPVGAEVTATATITAADGRKLTFTVTAADPQGQIGTATHIRFVVDRARFLAKL